MKCRNLVVGGGEGAVGGELPIYGIVWMCVPNGPLFQRCQVYDWPLFSAKSIWLAPFFWISIWKAPLFWCIPVHAHIFHLESFRSYLFSWYSMNRLLYFGYLPTINGYKNQRAGYEWVNISDDLVYEWVCFFKVQVYDGEGFEILARTPVPQLPPSYSPSPPPTPWGRNLFPRKIKKKKKKKKKKKSIKKINVSSAGHLL